MTLHDVARALRERRVAVVVSILVALLLGVALFLVRPAGYTATLTVYAAPRATDPAATTPEAAYQGSLLAKERIPSYVQLVTSPQVVSQVIARGQLPTDVEDLTGRVAATNTTDSVLVDVAVTAPSAAEAVATANAFGDVLPTAVTQIEQNGVPTAQPAVTLGVIRPVPTPLRPSTPGLGLTLLVALLAGVVVGVAVALVRDALDRSLRTSDDLAEALTGPGLPSPGPPVLAALPAPGSHSNDAEAFRQLRTALQAGRHGAPGVLVVASPGAGEGRTTVTTGLAAAAAAAGLGVVVVDADLRRPMVATTVDVAPGKGLTDVLSGRQEVDAVVRSTRAGFDVVPTGSLPSNPSELLAGGGLAEVLAALHTRYDLVLVDTPPTLPVTDAAVVAQAAGGVVLLARTRRTRPADLSRALRTFDAADATVVGAVLVGAAKEPGLEVEPGDRSAIVPRALRAGAAGSTSGRSANGATPDRDARTETARPAAPRAMPEPRAPEPRAPEPRAPGLRPAESRPAQSRPADGRPAGPGATVPPPASPIPAAGPAVPGGDRSPSRHGLVDDDATSTTAATPRATPRPFAPRGGGADGDAPTSGARGYGALSFVGADAPRRERNGHAQNGQTQNGQPQGQNGATPNGHSRHGRPDPDAPRRGR